MSDCRGWQPAKGSLPSPDRGPAKGTTVSSAQVPAPGSSQHLSHHQRPGEMQDLRATLCPDPIRGHGPDTKLLEHRA